MPETIVQGVSLYTKQWDRHAEIFDLGLTYGGIEIRRPGESARLLPWARVSEWEIEERRGGVLLTLRGPGSVTPLVVPKWKVDDLDSILRDVTSHSNWSIAEAESSVEAAAALVVEPEPEIYPAPKARVEASLVSDPGLDPELVAAGGPELVNKFEAEPERVVEPRSDGDLGFEDVVSRILAPPPIRTPDESERGTPLTQVTPVEAVVPGDGIAVASPAAGDDVSSKLVWPGDDVSSKLVWPSDDPLRELSDLSWPTSMGQNGDDDPVPEDFVLPEIPVLRSAAYFTESAEEFPSVADRATVDQEQLEEPMELLDPEPIPEPVEFLAPVEFPAPEQLQEPVDLPVTVAHLASIDVSTSVQFREPADLLIPERAPQPVSPAIVILPIEGSSDVAKPVPARAARRRKSRRAPILRAATAIVLLACLAAAVALVLAQSAGAIHLNFLGPPG